RVTNAIEGRIRTLQATLHTAEREVARLTRLTGNIDHASSWLDLEAVAGADWLHTRAELDFNAKESANARIDTRFVLSPELLTRIGVPEANEVTTTVRGTVRVKGEVKDLGISMELETDGGSIMARGRWRKPWGDLAVQTAGLDLRRVLSFGTES